MGFLAPSSLLWGIYFFYIYIRLRKSPGLFAFSLLNLLFFDIVLEDTTYDKIQIRMPINFILLIGALWILFFQKKWYSEYKQKKHLMPNKRFLLGQVFKPILIAILLTLFLFFYKMPFYIYLINLTFFLGFIWSSFRFWKILDPELQDLYFRPKGKRAVYARFIETIVFTVLLVIGYGIVCNKLDITLW